MIPKVLESLIRHASLSPGIYAFKNADDQIIYVGKAKCLRRRLLSYLRASPGSKTALMLSQAFDLSCVVTPSEAEALLLENNFIKRYRPKFNILFRDDKTYPYLALSRHAYPRIFYTRRKNSALAEYFGPYANAGAVHEMIRLVQQLFQLRSCRDAEFAQRVRPCVLHQIGRCLAPCVEKEKIADRYREQLQLARAFLWGKDKSVLSHLSRAMEMAASAQQYELAAYCRDRIRDLEILHKDSVAEYGFSQEDVWVVCTYGQHYGVLQMQIRSGRVVSQKIYRGEMSADQSIDELLMKGLSQHYLHEGAEDLPKVLLLASPLEEQALFTEAWQHLHNRIVKILIPERGVRVRWVQMAAENMKNELAIQHTVAHQFVLKVEALGEALGLENLGHIEVFDISHFRGEGTRAACVVFRDGELKASRHRAYVLGVENGDDYGAMREAMKRRYEKHPLPELLVIDGGVEQLRAVSQALVSMGLEVPAVLGIAKGAERIRGQERLLRLDGSVLELQRTGLAFLFLLQLRDTAHELGQKYRERASRKKRLFSSPLLKIPGVGKKIRADLLAHFGSLEAIREANIEALLAVPSIHRGLAEKIIEHLQLGD